MNTEPLTVSAYHGSGCLIDAFDFAFTGIGNDQNGSGFYFTSNLEEAAAYCSNRIESSTPKPGGEDAPTVHMAHIRFTRLLDAREELALDLSSVLKIIRRSPDLDSALENWDEVTDATRERIIYQAAKSYTRKQGDGPLIKSLFMLANDFFPGDTKAFNEAVRDVLGFDGVIEHFSDKTHYVVFFPEQIDLVARWSLEEVKATLNDNSEPVERPTGRRPTGG